MASVVFFGLLFTGLALLESTTAPDRWPTILRAAGGFFLIGAIPAGVLSLQEMQDAFCPSSQCQGDSLP